MLYPVLHHLQRLQYYLNLNQLLQPKQHFHLAVTEEMELEDIVSTRIEASALNATAIIEAIALNDTSISTFGKVIVDEMELNDLMATNAVLQSFYLGGANNTITTQAENTAPSGKLINDIDLGEYSGDYSHNNIMCSKVINELIAQNKESHNLTLNESLTKTLLSYALNSDIPAIPTYIVKQSDLQSYATKEDLIPY